MQNLAVSARSVWDKLLDLDSHIIGIAICVAAAYDWVLFYDGMKDLSLYFSQGVYSLSSLSALGSFFSAVYLTMASIVLLSLRPPLSRYRTVFPNLLALVAAFGIYLFALVPSGELLGAYIHFALILIVAGAVIVIVSLVYLRQAFSVTPHARFLVTSGPYSIVRHPMYVGNLLSLLGLALLIDSYPAFFLLLVCGGLQVARARYEERLLLETFANYAHYRRQVGAFLPRIKVRQRSLAAIVLCIFMMILWSPQTVMAAPSSGDWAKKCDEWYKIAMSDRWFNASQKDDFNKVDSDAKECRPFFKLQQECQSIVAAWLSSDDDDLKFIQKLESTKGCKAIAGFRNMCDALKNVARKGVRPTPERRTLLAECLRSELVKTRFDLLRPMM